MERHDGKEDFTITSQAAMLEVFDNIMNIITMAVGAIAGISLLVGAIGILTMMWIAVGERTQEIGLVRSIGATREQVQLVFLTEAAVLSTLGGLLGVGVGLGLCALLRTADPGSSGADTYGLCGGGGGDQPGDGAGFRCHSRQKGGRARSDRSAARRVT